MTIVPDRTIDCIGLYCPIPVVRTREAMREMAIGQVLEIEADDPAARADIERWSSRSGHSLLEVTRNGTVFRFLLRKTH